MNRNDAPRNNSASAVRAALQTIPHARVLRNEVLPEVIPAGGLIILRDGETGEPETMLSPISYYWQHRAMLDIAVQKGEAAGVMPRWMLLFEDIAAALSADRTLGGLFCDLVTPLAPEIRLARHQSGTSVKTAIVSIELIYVTDGRSKVNCYGHCMKKERSSSPII